MAAFESLLSWHGDSWQCKECLCFDRHETGCRVEEMEFSPEIELLTCKTRKEVIAVINDCDGNCDNPFRRGQDQWEWFEEEIQNFIDSANATESRCAYYESTGPQRF